MNREQFLYFDDSDLDRLQSEFTKIIHPRKIDRSVIPEEDRAVTVRDGKLVSVSRKKLYGDLQKQRLLAKSFSLSESANSGFQQRAIRGGENSIVGDIKFRLEDCLRLLGILCQSKRLEVKEERNIKINLNTIVENSLLYGNNLSEIELKIEQTKASYPILKRVEDLAGILHKAKECGDGETVNRIVEENREDLARYNSIRQVLAPDIESALNYRYHLLEEQRKSIKFQIHLYEKWGFLVRSQVEEEGLINNKQEIGWKLLVDLQNSFKSVEVGRQSLDDVSIDSDFQEENIQERNCRLEKEVSQLRGFTAQIIALAVGVEELYQLAWPD